MHGRSNQGGRTLLRLAGLWVLLIVLFVALYQLLASAGAPGADGERAPPSLAAPIFVIAFLGTLIAAVTVLVRRERRAIAVNYQGLSLLGQARYSEALAVFEEAWRRRTWTQAPLFHLNRGAAHLYLWNLPQAELELAQARVRRLGTDLSRISVPQHALALALQGKAADAERALADAQTLRLESNATVLLTRAVLAARRGEWDAVERQARRQEVKQLGGMLRALADTLVAWAVQQQNGGPRDVDRETLVGEASVDRLRGHWPELAAFVEAATQS